MPPLFPKSHALFGSPIKIASGTSGPSFVLCIALTPQSGDSSEAILEVPSEALLHPNARDERTLTERSGDDSPIGLLSRREGKSMGKEGNIYFQGRESIHEESR